MAAAGHGACRAVIVATTSAAIGGVMAAAGYVACRGLTGRCQPLPAGVR